MPPKPGRDNRSPIVVRSKLEPPSTIGRPLDRPRLTALLSPESSARVTLVCAPAGFGKTTLMRQAHAAHPPDRTAWLTLDAGDSDPGRFLFHLLAALGHPGGPHAPRDPGFDSLSATTEQTEALEATLAELPRGFTLFVDEIDAVRGRGALDLLARLLEPTRHRARLVLGGREVPAVPLGRLRMQGRLLEIDTNRLRFTADELTAVLAAALPAEPLGPEAVELLLNATEGWIGAVQMAILALRSTPDRFAFLRRFDGTNRELATFLAEDLLARQPPPLRDFLLSTSVLHQMTGPLCDAVLGRDDSDAVLRELSRVNMFVSSAGDDWYRYHNLFRSFLLDRAAALGGDHLRELRRRAARWCIGNGWPSTATTYALESGDQDLAGQLVDQAVMGFFEAGRLVTITEWAGPLDSEVLRRYPRVMLAYAWSLLALQQDSERLPHLVAALQARDDLDEALRNEVVYVAPFHRALRDELEDLDADCLATLERETRLSDFARGVLWNILSYILLHKGEHDRSMDAARRARDAHLSSGSAYGLGYAECFCGRVELQRGRLASARAQCRLATTIAESVPSEAMPRASAAAMRVRLCYETGDDARLQELMARFGPLVEQLGAPHELIDHFLLRADLSFASGDGAAAFETLGQLRQLGRARSHGRMVASAWALQAQLAARLGDDGAARDYLAQAAGEPRLRAFGGSLQAESEAIVALGAGRLDEAREVLRIAGDRARRIGDALGADRLRALEAERHLAAGEVAAARAAMDDVLRLVEREGLVRPVLRAPAPVRAAFAERAAHLRLPVALVARLGTPVADSTIPLEPLSRREVEVLGEVVKGLSNRAIAAALHISVPTVKTHLRRINEKLMASNRTEAAAKARRLGLVPPG